MGPETLERLQRDPPECLFIRLPLSILTCILRWVFVPHPYYPLVFPKDSVHRVQTFSHIRATLPVLKTCKLILRVGAETFYRENTFTTATPSTSYDFDRTLGRMSAWQQLLITSITLQIDWADELWAKFPLIAVALKNLRKLEKLEIFLVPRTPPASEDLLSLVRVSQEAQERRREETRRFDRHGTAAEAMLKAEKKTFKDLVCMIRTLRVFKLVGFADEEFARQLEGQVNGKGHSWG